jgi:hypothetical protein
MHGELLQVEEYREAEEQTERANRKSEHQERMSINSEERYLREIRQPQIRLATRLMRLSENGSRLQCEESEGSEAHATGIE